MGKQNSKTIKENRERLPHKIMLRLLSEDPQNSNLSAIADILGTTPQKLWYYVAGYARWPAEEFLDILLMKSKIRLNKSGKTATLTIPLNYDELLKYQGFKQILDNVDTKATRVSSFIGN